MAIRAPDGANNKVFHVPSLLAYYQKNFILDRIKNFGKSPHLLSLLWGYFIACYQAYFILDEFLLAGEIQETSKKCVLNAIKLQVLSLSRDNIKIRNATKRDSQKSKDVECDSKPGFCDGGRDAARSLWRCWTWLILFMSCPLYKIFLFGPSKKDCAKLSTWSFICCSGKL